MKKWLTLIIVVLVLLFAWRIYEKVRHSKTNEYGGSQSGGRKGGGAVAVETGKITRMDMDDVSMFSGNLIAKNSFIVAPKISGTLTDLKVNLGDVVRKGQVLAQLDDRIYRQDYEKAKAAVEVAQATADQTANTLELSEQTLNHNKALLQKNYISQDEYNQTNSQYIADKSRNNIALANLHSSQAALKSAEIQLSYTKITADWNDKGVSRVIGEKYVNEGSMLNTGAPIVSVLDINTLVAAIDVIESDYARIHVGQPAILTTDTYPGQKFMGRIARIAPMLQESSRQARVEVEIANTGSRLKPGMYARVQIVYQHKQQVSVIPAAALCTHKKDSGVFLVDKKTKKVTFVKIVTGIQNKDFIEIVAPAIQGDVVTLGQDQLEDGKSVLLPKTGGKKSPHQQRGGSE